MRLVCTDCMKEILGCITDRGCWNCGSHKVVKYEDTDRAWIRWWYELKKKSANKT